MEKKNQCSGYMRVSAVREVFREYLSNLYAQTCPVWMSTKHVLIEYLSIIGTMIVHKYESPSF